MRLRHIVIGGARLGLGALPVFLIATMTASPLLAADECVPTRAAFSPGTWVASGITLNSYDEDDRSIVMDHGEGGFRLVISATGDASGTISLVGSGIAASTISGDDSGMTVEWMVNGNLSGNGTVIDIDGTQDLKISGVIDSNPNGDGDEWSGSGNEFWGFGNETSRDYHGSFSPSDANCRQVFGSFGGPVEYGTFSSGGESYFLAVRVGSAPNLDVESQLVELMERAESIVNMNPVDTDLLGAFIQDFLAFDSLLASLEYCELVETNAGPAWQMLRSVLLGVTHTFLAAPPEAYTTREVIHVMTLVLQGGILGLRGNDCLEPGNPDGIGGLMDRFDLVLLERLKAAHSGEEITLIIAAAYQFQLPTTIQYIEEHL